MPLAEIMRDVRSLRLREDDVDRGVAEVLLESGEERDVHGKTSIADLLAGTTQARGIRHLPAQSPMPPEKTRSGIRGLRIGAQIHGESA